MQEGINQTLSWGNNNGLTFNPKKTQVVVFESGRKTTVKVPKLSLGETKLE